MEDDIDGERTIEGVGCIVFEDLANQEKDVIKKPFPGNTRSSQNEFKL